MVIVFQGTIKMEKPSILKQLVTLSKSTIVQIVAGNPQCTDEKLEKRVETCLMCPSLDKENFRCNECGCFLKFKTLWETSKCPLGKWEDKSENS